MGKFDEQLVRNQDDELITVLRRPAARSSSRLASLRVLFVGANDLANCFASISNTLLANPRDSQTRPADDASGRWCPSLFYVLAIAHSALIGLWRRTIGMRCGACLYGVFFGAASRPGCARACGSDFAWPMLSRRWPWA